MTFVTAHEIASRLPAHRHREPYVSLVLQGCYQERSVDGSYAVERGSIIYHPSHHMHANTFEASSAIVLNRHVRLEPDVAYAIAHVPRLAPWLERQIRCDTASLGPILAEILHSRAAPAQTPPGWLSRLVERLRDGVSRQPIREICRELGITPEHASRACVRAFGIGPQSIRREFRLRMALTALASGVEPCVAAQQAGFADQSHLGRVMKDAIGQTPARYRSGSRSSRSGWRAASYEGPGAGRAP